MLSASTVSAWRPCVAGVAEVLHARLVGHTYPMHTHDSWTLLIIDDGIVRYDLEGHEHGAFGGAVTLLPPHVAHNGAPVTADGLRKRVLYLDTGLLGGELIGPAVDGPRLRDALLRRRIHQLHGVLGQPGDELEAESRMAFVTERLRQHLARQQPARRHPERQPGPAASLRNPAPLRDPGLAHRLRDLLDARVAEGVTLQEASGILHAHPTHLVRAFSGEFGIAPHQYVIGRRVDHARRLLLDGMPLRTVAATTGFYDQPHLTRHFTRVLGVSPGRYARVRPAESGRGAR